MEEAVDWGGVQMSVARRNYELVFRIISTLDIESSINYRIAYLNRVQQAVKDSVACINP